MVEGTHPAPQRSVAAFAQIAFRLAGLIGRSVELDVVAELSTPCEVGMIARLWQTHIDPVRAVEYDAFAATYSRTMFAALPDAWRRSSWVPVMRCARC